MNEYKHAVDRLRNKPGMCLRILRSMVDGPAYKIIKHYLLDEDDPAECLQGALRTLKMAFGSEFKQSRAHLKGLLSLTPNNV